jgi:hypothetical protein
MTNEYEPETYHEAWAKIDKDWHKEEYQKFIKEIREARDKEILKLLEKSKCSCGAGDYVRENINKIKKCK